MSNEITALDVYMQIAAYIVPLIGLGMLWLLFRHFDLKQSVSELKKDMEANSKSDDETKGYIKDFLSEVKTINDRLTSIEAEVRLLINDRNK